MVNQKPQRCKLCNGRQHGKEGCPIYCEICIRNGIPKIKCQFPTKTHYACRAGPNNRPCGHCKPHRTHKCGKCGDNDSDHRTKNCKKNNNNNIQIIKLQGNQNVGFRTRQLIELQHNQLIGLLGLQGNQVIGLQGNQVIGLQGLQGNQVIGFNNNRKKNNKVNNKYATKKPPGKQGEYLRWKQPSRRKSLNGFNV